MAVENRANGHPPRLGREVVIGKSVLPGTHGRGTIFRTKFDPEADPISPELEADMLKHASSDAMREVLKENIAEARGAKPVKGK